VRFKDGNTNAVGQECAPTARKNCKGIGHNRAMQKDV
jgi:hypothetical protein